MGLDNGFVIRNKRTRFEMELCSFRNFYPLAEYFRKFSMLPYEKKEDDDPDDGLSYEYAVTEENLSALKAILQPIYEEIKRLPLNTVSYYDENGYPAKYNKMFYGNEFDPTSANYSFAGSKLIHLYERIESVMEVLENINMSQDYPDTVIVFYDSY